MRDNLEHTIQSPLCQNRRMYTHKKMHKEKKRRKHTNILPVTVSEWTGWQMIFIFFLRILLDFLNCYNDFPNQTTNKTKTKAKLYLFQQANGNVGVQGPLVGFIQHDGTRIRGTISNQPLHKPIQTIKGTAGYLAPMRSPCSKSNAK